MVSTVYAKREYKRNRLYTLEAAGYRCEVKGPRCLGRASTADHIIPVSQGGGNELANLRASCPACNSRGGAHLTNAGKAGRRLGRASRRW